MVEIGPACPQWRAGRTGVGRSTRTSGCCRSPATRRCRWCSRSSRRTLVGRSATKGRRRQDAGAVRLLCRADARRFQNRRSTNEAPGRVSATSCREWLPVAHLAGIAVPGDAGFRSRRLRKQEPEDDIERRDQWCSFQRAAQLRCSPPCPRRIPLGLFATAGRRRRRSVGRSGGGLLRGAARHRGDLHE
jgi:hypothetical protein